MNYPIQNLKIKFNNYLYYIVLSLITISCNNLPKEVSLVMNLSGNNQKELQKVIDSYKTPKDSLKLKAAYFLIGNMSNKSFRPYNQAQQKLINYIDSLYISLESNENYDYNAQYEEVNNLISERWEVLKKKHSSITSRVKDIDVVTAKILIENINFAFKVWDEVPWAEEYSFEEFCEYILPYRTRYDTPVLWRNKFYKKYSWVLDSIKDSSDFLYASKLINDSLNWGYNYSFTDFSQSSIIDVKNINRGICRQHTSLKIAILRSIGIPVADVSGLQSTTWAIVPDKNKKFWGWEDIQPPVKNSPFIDTQRYIDYPKVYEYSFKIQDFPFENIPLSDVPQRFYDLSRKDITKDHSDFMNVSVDLSIKPPKKTDYVFLCIFNKSSKSWEAAHWSEIKNNTAYFDQMGLGCVYLPMYYLNKQYSQAGVPFFLNKDKEKVILKSDINNQESVKLYRKCYMKYWDNRNADLFVNNVFEGANNRDFTDAEQLFIIKEKPKNYEEKEILNDRKFRYVRHISMSTKPMWIDEFSNDLELAEMGFYGANKIKLKGKYLSSSRELLKNIENAFDDDIRTNFSVKNNITCWFGLDFGKPQKISSVKYLFRNSFNIVEPGDDYELLYWDMEWKSLGIKTSTENFVEFDAPKHALLWLKNLNKGREESLFYMNKGKQEWVH
jgi:hypothetical protein